MTLPAKQWSEIFCRTRASSLRALFRPRCPRNPLCITQHALTKFPIFLRTMNARQWLCIAIAARTSEHLLISAPLHWKVSQQQRLEKSRNLRIQVPWQDERLIEGRVSIASQSVFIRHCVDPFARCTAAQGRSYNVGRNLFTFVFHHISRRTIPFGIRG